MTYDMYMFFFLAFFALGYTSLGCSLIMTMAGFRKRPIAVLWGVFSFFDFLLAAFVNDRLINGLFELENTAHLRLLLNLIRQADFFLMAGFVLSGVFMFVNIVFVARDSTRVKPTPPSSKPSHEKYLVVHTSSIPPEDENPKNVH